MKQIAAIIEIGTGKLVCMIAQSGAADGFNLLGAAVTAYSCYNKKGWIEPKELRYAFGSVISEAEKQAGQKMCFFSALFLFVRKKNKGSRKRKDRSRKFIGIKN